MKIKTSAIALCFVSVIVIVLGLVFYNYGLPFLNFMNNQVPEESGSAEKPSIDSILMGTPEPGTTGNPNDHPLTIAVLIFYSLVSLLTILIVDLSYGIIDPRIRLEAK